MKFFITGTHAYGPISPDSDLDIVMMPDDAHLIQLFLLEHGIKMYRTPAQDSYGLVGGYYFNLQDMQVNIIIAENEWEYAQWKTRTDKMKALPPIKDREERIATFNNITVLEKGESNV